jgi:hypothetical protein
MAVVEVTSSRFRQKKKIFLDLADKETPDDDFFFTPEMLSRIDLSMQHAKEGKFKILKTPEDIKALLGL